MRLSLIQRLGARTVVTPEGCWEWRGSVTKNGYGQISIGTSPNRKGLYTHRVGFAAFGGVIPEGRVTDHLCRNRRCWNPAHLEPVTPSENILRGALPGILRERYAAQTHCIRNHEFTPENTRRSKAGKRQCRTCERMRFRAVRAERRLLRDRASKPR